jgi:anti-sigma factor RsiW
MNVTRDVILDLLPLYVAGEASPATRELVEEYLKGDPELAARARGMHAQMGAPHLPSLAPETEMKSLRRTRQVLAWQRWLFGLGIALTAIGCSLRIEFDGARPTSVHVLLFDYPYPFAASLVLGIACLLAYRTLRRRHRTGA